MPHNISVKVGDTVRLPCKVNQPGTNIVSWVRNTDYSIIAIDEDTVTHDSRFFVVKSSEPLALEWMLVIRNVSLSDAGSYECQLNTKLKMCHKIQLNVPE